MQSGVTDMAVDISLLPRNPDEPPLSGLISTSNFCYSRQQVFFTLKPERLPPRLDAHVNATVLSICLLWETNLIKFICFYLDQNERLGESLFLSPLGYTN